MARWSKLRASPRLSHLQHCTSMSLIYHKNKGLNDTLSKHCCVDDPLSEASQYKTDRYGSGIPNSDFCNATKCKLLHIMVQHIEKRESSIVCSRTCSCFLCKIPKSKGLHLALSSSRSNHRIVMQLQRLISAPITYHVYDNFVDLSLSYTW